MGQVVIYIDDNLLKEMDHRAKDEGKSRSSWVKEVIQEKLQTEIPDSWFQLWGSWEDDRTISEILADIDVGYVEKEREKLR